MAKGDRYVEITREDLEGWLRSNFGSKWNRDTKYQGVYLIHLSDAVAIKLTSTIGATGQVRGLGRASMSLSLVSRLIDRPPLNRKAKDRKSFMRTKGWKKTWLAGVRHWQGVYEKSADFYDKIGRGEDPSSKPSAGNAYQPDEEFLGKLRQLWVAARGRSDDWTQEFAASVGKQVKQRPPTDKQKSLAERKFREYRIAQRVASRFLGEG